MTNEQVLTKTTLQYYKYMYMHMCVYAKSNVEKVEKYSFLPAD